nr:hypothetical protein [Tanacetum cinerariifolium]
LVHQDVMDSNRTIEEITIAASQFKQ